MTQAEYLAKFQALQTKKIDLTTRKNADYATGQDAFANFTLIERVTNGATSTEEGLLTRLSDKVSRIGNLLFRDPLVVGESLQDALEDLAVYADILNIYVTDKRDHQENP